MSKRGARFIKGSRKRRRCGGLSRLLHTSCTLLLFLPGLTACAERTHAGQDAASRTTPCGSTRCERASEICVEYAPIGPGSSFECAPVPEGCERDRSCDCVGATLCAGNCHDEPEENTVLCYYAEYQ